MVIAHRLVLAAWDEAPGAFASAALALAAGQPRLLVLLEAAVKPFIMKESFLLSGERSKATRGHTDIQEGISLFEELTTWEGNNDTRKMMGEGRQRDTGCSGLQAARH